MWGEVSITTALGAKRGLDSSREHDRLYRATMQAVADGLILGRGRHGVVVALTNDPNDPRFSLAVKIVSKVFMPSGKGREGSFHRVVAHTLHVQNEVASNAKLSDESTFVLPLYAAMQDDTYVYLVMERACCSLKQLIQHGDDGEQRQLLNFQEEHPLKFLSFCTLTTAAMLHACWTMQRSRIIHHDIHPAQILVTQDGRCAPTLLLALLSVALAPLAPSLRADFAPLSRCFPRCCCRSRRLLVCSSPAPRRLLVCSHLLNTIHALSPSSSALTLHPPSSSCASSCCCLPAAAASSQPLPLRSGPDVGRPSRRA